MKQEQSLDQPPETLLTVGSCLELGMSRFEIACQTKNCGRTAVVTFDQMRLPNALPFVDIASTLKTHCSKCGERNFTVSPVWADARRYGKRR